eukprot:810878_1
MAVLLNVYGQYQQNVHHRILAHCRQQSISSSGSVSASASETQNRKGTNEDAGDEMKNKNRAATSTSISTVGNYSLPQGGWFEYISCPHYLAEIII